MRYALRRLGREPGFAAAAIVTLAIGIGSCTAMFSIVQAVLLRPFGVDTPSRVVVMWPTQHGGVGEFTYNAHRDMRARMRSLADVALLGSVNWGESMAIGGGEPVDLMSAAVSGTFFGVLGAHPLVGRTFTTSDDEPTARRVLVLSHGLWTRRFAADPGVVGRTVHVGGDPFEVVGVMPPAFFFPRGADYWTPAAPYLAKSARGAPLEPLFDGLGVFFAVGRLSDGTSLRAAQADVSPFLNGIADEKKLDLSSSGIAMTPIADHIFGQARPALTVLMGAVVVVLLIACTNVASLLLARGASRTRELAVRASLGASRRALMRQLLTESGVLAVAGAIVGLSVASLTLRALVSLSPSDIPRLDATRLDAGALAFALLMTAATTVLLGLAPAWHLSRPSLTNDLKGSSGTTGRSGRARVRQSLVAMQVAGTLVLLIAMGLVTKSFAQLTRLDLGFDPTNVLTFSVKGLNEERYPGLAQRDVVERLTARFERLPQVVAAGALSQRPFENGAIGWDTGFRLEGQPDIPDTRNRNPMLNWETISGNYFRAMGIRLVRGRTFEPTDTTAAPLVVIVSEAMASRVWPGQDPIGKRLQESLGFQGPGETAPRWQTVVGVVATARYREIESPRLDIYVPLRQAVQITHFTVRTAVDPVALVPLIAAEIVAFDSGFSIEDVATMEALVGRTRGPWQFNMLVFSLFGLVALALAAVGLYGLVAHAVTQRTREIGVRMALGATPGHVVRLMVSHAARPTVVGLAVGVLVSLLSGRLLSGLLFGVSATDPGTFAGVAVLLSAVTVVASYLPARRAASVDPLVVLRSE